MSTKSTYIMDSVDILDRIDILLFQPVPGHFNVDFVCKEHGKQFVMDKDALKSMENKILDLCRTKSAQDQNTSGYIKEFIGRFIQKAHKLDLAVIEDVPDAIDDHYKNFRAKN